MSGPAALVLLATGVVVAGVGIVLFLTRGAGPGRPSRTLLAFAGVCAAFFGLYELLSLAVVEGLGERLVWASVAVMAGLTSWSLAGLKPRPGARPDAVVVGATLIFVGALGLLVALGVAGWSSGGAPALVVVVVSAAVAGLGMGLAYPLLGSEPFDLPGRRRPRWSAPWSPSPRRRARRGWSCSAAACIRLCTTPGWRRSRRCYRFRVLGLVCLAARSPRCCAADALGSDGTPTGRPAVADRPVGVRFW